MFLDLGTRSELGVSVTPRLLSTPGKDLAPHFTGGWVGHRAGLDRCGKSRPHWDSIPGPSNPWSVNIPTELPGPIAITTATTITTTTNNNNNNSLYF
jgi:hypothetical protein